MTLFDVGPAPAPVEGTGGLLLRGRGRDQRGREGRGGRGQGRPPS